jgi:hypothetical protein
MTLPSNKKSFKIILLAGFTAGLLDAIAAMTSFMINVPGGNPLKVWRFVASGALGKESIRKDLVPMAIAGLLFHFLIAFLFTLLFYLFFPKMKLLWRNLVITGLVYGVFVWVVMNFIIVPLSGVPEKSKLWTITNGQPAFQFPANPKQLIIGILIIMFCVGLPISFIIGNYFRKQFINT